MGQFLYCYPALQYAYKICSDGRVRKGTRQERHPGPGLHHQVVYVFLSGQGLGRCSSRTDPDRELDQAEAGAFSCNRCPRAGHFRRRQGNLSVFGRRMGGRKGPGFKAGRLRTQSRHPSLARKGHLCRERRQEQSRSRRCHPICGSRSPGL